MNFWPYIAAEWKPYQTWNPPQIFDPDESSQTQKDQEGTPNDIDSLENAFPSLSGRPNRWFNLRRQMINNQLPTVNLLSKTLQPFIKSVRIRLASSRTLHPLSYNCVIAKVEKSLISFLEAQAYTRALLKVKPGEESDVHKLYDWWQALWMTIPYEDLLTIPKSETTFSMLLNQGLPASDILWVFLMIDQSGRFQEKCSAWMVTNWIDSAMPSWAPRLDRVLQRDPKSRATRNKLRSELLVEKLHALGLPRINEASKESES